MAWESAVNVIDGQLVGAGVPGPLTLQLRAAWADSTPVRYDERN